MKKRRYFYKVPAHVSYAEAAELYSLMATGETTKTDYLDKRNQLIFEHLSRLMEMIGSVGTQQFTAYLTEQNLLIAAGGSGYIQKVFGCLEPEEAVCW